MLTKFERIRYKIDSTCHGPMAGAGFEHGPSISCVTFHLYLYGWALGLPFVMTAGVSGVNGNNVITMILLAVINVNGLLFDHHYPIKRLYGGYF